MSCRIYCRSFRQQTDPEMLLLSCQPPRLPGRFCGPNYKITQKILFLGAISPETREVAAALTVRAARAPNIRFVSRANKLSWVYIRRSRLPSKNRHSRMRSNCALRIQKRTNAPHNRSSPLCGLPLRSIDASDQAHAGSPTVSSNPTAISSIIAVKRGTNLSISPGASCPSDCATGRTGSDQ